MVIGTHQIDWHGSLHKAGLLLLAAPACFFAFTILLKIVLGLPLLLLFPTPLVALSVSLFASACGILAAVFLCRSAWPD
jgi:hypothetical protein